MFDITATGVRSHYKESHIPFLDDTGQLIENQSSRNRARNQQRNWETVNQIISLRTLPENIVDPQFDADTKTWIFRFDINNIESVTLNNDPVGALMRDCDGIPMIIGLGEQQELSQVLQTQGPRANIWFELVSR